jgi:hypothetical protein
VYSSKWSRELRQGDVFGLWPYPKLRGSPQLIARPQGWAQDADVLTALEYPAEAKFCVILSHCCEFTEGRRERFLVARLQKVNERWPEEKRAAILASNDTVEVKGKPRYEFLEFFALDPLDGCYPDPMLIDFNTITTLTKDALSQVKALKRAELEHPHRIHLRRKLAFFLGRDAPDVAEDKKVDAPAPTTQLVYPASQFVP